ncbi:hypothetical protein [Pelagicoccus mobilis]|uniref:Uncharacterized protein n=1 Tax=Pelagicoccus mobilis TaxID=415221 RepID=A0A934VU19_9BACT|nr:hypothetical protein [Pelagicoccus mobilis]MBK1880640.1 hypothetical protein [Pelagicoccus mobilis]
MEPGKESNGEIVALVVPTLEEPNVRSAFSRIEVGSVESLSEEAGHSHSLGLWSGSIEPAPNKWNAPTVSELEPLRMELSTPDGEEHQLEFDRFVGTTNEKGTYIGSLVGEPASQAIFSYVNDAVVATMRLPSRNTAWEIRNQGSGVQLFEKVDLSKMKFCELCRYE